MTAYKRAVHAQQPRGEEKRLRDEHGDREKNNGESECERWKREERMTETRRGGRVRMRARKRNDRVKNERESGDAREGS